MSSALAEAHKRGIIHRDIKPSNILLCEGGRLKLLDFGLARSNGNDDEVTAEGFTIGTPAYMAPEQVSGAEVDARTDVFALGILLYWALVGRHPFRRENPSATALAIASATFEPLKNMQLSLPSPITSLVDSCLSLRPEDRPASAQQLVQAFALVRNLAPESTAAELQQGFEALRLMDAQAVNAQPVGSEVLDSWGDVTSSSPSLEGQKKRAEQDVFSLPSQVGVESVGGRVPQGTVLKHPERLFWVILAVLALVAGATFFVTQWAQKQAQKQAQPLANLPPKAVLSVLTFHSAEAGTEALVFSDSLRQYLSWYSDSFYVTPLETLYGQGDGQLKGLGVAPETLRRDKRRFGHVDLALKGTLRQEDSQFSLNLTLVETEGGDSLYEQNLQFEKDNLFQSSAALAQTLAELLGAQALPSPGPLSGSIEAYDALLTVQRESRAAHYSEAKEALQTSLRLEPSFALARVERLALLHAERRVNELSQEARALLQEPSVVLPPPARARVEAWQAYGEGDVIGTFRRLQSIVEIWPYETEAYYLLLVLLHSSPEVRNLSEATEVAKRLLAIAPNSSIAASRLIRSLSYRGLVEEAEQSLLASGFDPSDERSRELWAEMDLFLGNYDDASQAIEQILAETGGSIYFEHLAITASLLAGDCEDATARALNRISDFEARGLDSNLDWTYSLAIESLICEEQWASAEQVVNRWIDRGGSGAKQGPIMLLQMALAAGQSRQVVAEGLRQRLEFLGARAIEEPALFMLLARVSTSKAELKSYGAQVKEASVNPGSDPAVRASHQRALGALRAKLALLSGDLDLAYTLYNEQLTPWNELRAEGEASERLTSVALAAEAFAEMGKKQESQALWATIVNMGQLRLWRTDLWLMAKQHLEEQRFEQ